MDQKKLDVRDCGWSGAELAGSAQDTTKASQQIFTGPRALQSSARVGYNPLQDHALFFAKAVDSVAAYALGVAT